MSLRSGPLPIILIVWLSTLVDVDARAWRSSQVPNGLIYNCALCHLNPRGTGPLNEFGNDVNSRVAKGSRLVFWSEELARLDSDGDGFTNGEELNDPDGDGIASNDDPVTHPGDADSKPTVRYSVPDVAEIGLNRLVPDRIVFETQQDNLEHWEPSVSALGTNTFMIMANTFAPPLAGGKQRYGIFWQTIENPIGKESASFFDDQDNAYLGPINASRQDGNPGRIAGDPRPGATGYAVGGEASPHRFAAFDSNDRWNLGFERSETGRFGLVQTFALDHESLSPRPTSLAIDAINGRLTEGACPNERIGEFGGDLVVLDNGNVLAVVTDHSGIRGPTAAATAVILAPNGAIVKESWVIDSRDIWANVAAYRNGFCVRVHDSLYFHDNTGELLGKLALNDSLPSGARFDTGRGENTRIASHINHSLVFMVGATPLFDAEGNALKDAEDQPRKGVQISVFEAASREFLASRAVSEISEDLSGSDEHDLFGDFGRVDLAVDALGRVAVAFEWTEPETEQPQTLVRILSFDRESRQWETLTPSFHAFLNHGPADGIRSVTPSISVTTQAILVAAKGEINRQNQVSAGADSPARSIFYTAFSHPVPLADPTPKATAPAAPIYLSIVSLTDRQLSLAWTNGDPPFSVQQKTALNDSEWITTEETSERNITISTLETSGFIRVVGQATSAP